MKTLQYQQTLIKYLNKSVPLPSFMWLPGVGRQLVHFISDKYLPCHLPYRTPADLSQTVPVILWCILMCRLKRKIKNRKTRRWGSSESFHLLHRSAAGWTRTGELSRGGRTRSVWMGRTWRANSERKQPEPAEHLTAPATVSMFWLEAGVAAHQARRCTFILFYFLIICAVVAGTVQQVPSVFPHGIISVFDKRVWASPQAGQENVSYSKQQLPVCSTNNTLEGLRTAGGDRQYSHWIWDDSRPFSVPLWFYFPLRTRDKGTGLY